MKKILVLHTGGTIAMSADEDGAVAPTDQNPMAGFEKLFDNQLIIESEEFANLPSPHITPAVMLNLKNRIQQAEEDGIDGVVVTHGTDTLEETAYFLDLTLPNNIPVVVTGAMRSSNEIGADGLHNLISAVWTAASDDAHDKGVLVVMNDEIHTARYVTKTHTTNVATFRTPTFGPIGLVSKHNANFFQELIRSEICDIKTLVEPVYLLKVYAGMDGTLFDAINQPNTKGLVIEALGAGNLPPATLPAVQALLDRNIPIVLVSRCFNGIAEDVYDYQGGGVKLKQMGVTFCQGLNGPKARLKLQVGLSAGKTGAALKEFVSNATS
ncbi:asparaginase [Latilactobacillus curvatus]|uniref:asparaginase n=1 Tax=Latilactobacillus curvatus TaxID=28038 RepID=UPI000849EF51|nr:asparaginase [Latilactobacillus curvatus]AOO74845.1 L-asparaginase [Latilactobacillus curvatus]AZP97049.1 asparaginase [Latilactobacillus curvatus]MED9788190.1 asparaginase [Latilactobacillus curvatus]QEA48730.1 asparaginase [Latilactobacillus curvatus]WBY49155.1 asparaginase [Latilactobacillus curvatus]